MQLAITPAFYSQNWMLIFISDDSFTYSQLMNRAIAFSLVS